MKLKRVDATVKRYILRQGDTICIGKNSNVAFTFLQAHQVHNNISNYITEQYHIRDKLGYGSFGTVFLAQHRTTCDKFALKFTREDPVSIATIIHEANVLRELKHPCVIEFYGDKIHRDTVAIILQYAEGGDLQQRIAKSTGSRLTECMTKFYLYQVSVALAYIHGKNVTHRDIKPNNLLLLTNKPYTLVKVADFGFSNNRDSVMTSEFGHTLYTAPEVSVGDPKYTNTVDS